MTEAELRFVEAVRTNISIAGVIRSLGRAVVGTSYRFVRREVVRLGLDTSHWLGQRHGTSASVTKRPLSEMLVERCPAQRGKVKQRLLKLGLLRNECYECGLPALWNGKPLVFHLDHVNGVRDDCRLENLRLICPNCHSQTPTYAGRNKKRRHAPVA